MVINPNDSCSHFDHIHNDTSHIVNLRGKSRLGEQNMLNQNQNSVMHSDDMVYTPGRQSVVSLKLD
jgi:hypothetical protein